MKENKKEQMKELVRLQNQRTKANKSKKGYWNKKIDKHFGLS